MNELNNKDKFFLYFMINFVISIQLYILKEEKEGFEININLN